MCSWIYLNFFCSFPPCFDLFGCVRGWQIYLAVCHYLHYRNDIYHSSTECNKIIRLDVSEKRQSRGFVGGWIFNKYWNISVQVILFHSVVLDLGQYLNINNRRAAWAVNIQWFPSCLQQDVQEKWILFQYFWMLNDYFEPCWHNGSVELYRFQR